MRVVAAAVLVALALAAAAGPALAEACRRSDAPVGRKARRDCPPVQKLEPYEPGLRAGRTPGFVDIGNGTEVRVGGRVQMDYDVRRR